ncbi:MAG: iron ABC transporter substrate-binding protein [Bacteroidales bacterium]|nr:iron ABC transporter substrate-binding protein [Bacteroidales bacterium]
MRTIQYLIPFILSALIMGCKSNPLSNQDGETAVTDMLGRQVMIPSAVNRIVGLRAGALRLLVYMDAVDMIAGVEESETDETRPYLQAHPSLKELPVVGPSMGGDAELIVKINPDVIFISYTTKEDADALRHKTGIPVIAVECPEFGTERDILYASLSLIGKVLNKEQRADSLISYIDRSVEELHNRTAEIPVQKKPSVYIGGVPYSGSHGINSTQPWFPPFMFVNAINAASEIDERLVSHVKGTYIDKEQLLMWDPDVLFIDESGLSMVRQDLAKGTALFSNLKAVRNDSIFILLPYNNYAVNYELVLANAWYAGKILYPDNFADVEIQEKTDEILNVFLGQAFYKKLMNNSSALRQLKKDEF